MPSALSEDDRERWNLMTAAQRKRAADRLQAIEQWEAGAIPIEVALESTGRSRSRFYRMASDWRAERTLTALGAFAGTGGTKSRLDPVAVNALQAVVARVVRLNKGATVKQLVELMVAEADVPERAVLPGTSRLRGIVEDEQRRVSATGDAGHTVKLDCSAINLPREDGRPFAAFTILDKGTRLILGAAVAAEPEAAGGYRLAAIDAQERIGRIGQRLPWSVRLREMEVTAGTDLDASVALIDRLTVPEVGSNPQLASAPRRFGNYFREIVGMRIGRVEITPLRTQTGNAMPDNGDMTAWTIEEAAEALRQGVESHNELMLAGIGERGGRRVTEGLQRALEIIVGA